MMTQSQVPSAWRAQSHQSHFDQLWSMHTMQPRAGALISGYLILCRGPTQKILLCNLKKNVEKLTPTLRNATCQRSPTFFAPGTRAPMRI